MIEMENKWKKLKILQLICMASAVICWIVVVVPLVADIAGYIGVRAWFSQHVWVLPVFGLLAIVFTTADLLLGYRVYVHNNREKHPRVHHSKRRKK